MSSEGAYQDLRVSEGSRVGGLVKKVKGLSKAKQNKKNLHRHRTVW